MFYFCLNHLHNFVSRWHLLISVSKNLDPDQAKHSVQIWSGSKLFDTWRLWQVEVEQIYFNFALNLYMTLPSADNPFKRFGPRSGSTFCPDLIGVQALWRFRGYDKLKLNQCILTCVKPLHDIDICWLPFQTIWTQVRPNILYRPDRG